MKNHAMEVSEILEGDQTFCENVRAMIRHRVNDAVFGMVRNHLVRSALHRFNQRERQMANARRHADRMERELFAL